MARYQIAHFLLSYVPPVLLCSWFHPGERRLWLCWVPRTVVGNYTYGVAQVLNLLLPGARAAQLIAAGLPDGWRIVLIDRNSYVLSVLYL